MFIYKKILKNTEVKVHSKNTEERNSKKNKFTVMFHVYCDL